MRRIENDCCDCATPGYPCLGSLCPRRHAVHIYCDNRDCDADITNDHYIFDGKEYCAECILDVLLEEEVIERKKI